MARSRATRRRNEAPEAPVETEEAIIIADRCESILQFLSELEPPEVPAPGQLPDAVAFPACSPPDIRIPPQFVIPLRRPMLLCSFDVPIGDGVDTPFLQLACVKLASLEVSLGIDLRFEQIWNLQRLGLGDLASTMG